MVSGPVLMIGLDGADWSTIEREAADGRLPAIAALLARGRHGPVSTARGFSDATAWTSFATGLRPAHHGWANVQMLRPGTYEVEEVRRDRVAAPPFWQNLSDAGRTVTVLDVPKAPRGHDLRGIELVDWWVHGTDDGTTASDPPSLAADVEHRFGPGHGGDCGVFGEPVDGFRSFLSSQVKATTGTGQLGVELLRDGPTDLTIVVFSASHCVGHACWHLHDPDHSARDEALVAALGDPVVDHYRLIDEQIGRLVAEVDDEATIVLFAGLGMGSSYFDVPFLDEILHRLDSDLRPRAAAQQRLQRFWRTAVPQSWRNAMPRRWHQAATAAAGAARAGRSFFPLDAGSRSGAVRVNLAGREPAGIVPADGLEATLDRLERSLRDLRDVDDGEPIVDDVERVAHSHDGPHVPAFPDLLVHWRNRPVRAARSDEVGAVSRPEPTRSGHHTGVGFWAVAAPDIGPGPEMATIDITDLGIATAARLGVHIGGTDATPVPALTRRD